MIGESIIEQNDKDIFSAKLCDSVAFQSNDSNDSDESDKFMSKIIKINIVNNVQYVEFLPENDDGNVEYKLRLDTKDRMGLKKIASQMKWRMNEGKELYNLCEAHYILGVADDGTLGGLTKDELDKTYNIFLTTVSECKAIVHFNKEYEYDGTIHGCHSGKIIFGNISNKSHVMHVIVCKKHVDRVAELNVMFVGPSCHGKTTVISSLAHGCTDNGSGSARHLILKYAHEKVNGQTSAVKKEIIGIKGDMLVNFTTGMHSDWASIVGMSDKIINLIDLPGDKKYAKSTYFGLLSYRIDVITLVIDINSVDDSESLYAIDFYNNIATLMNVPIIMLLTKIDLNNVNVPDQWYNILTCIGISNVSGNGFDKYLNYLNKIDIRKNNDDLKNKLFTIIESYNIPDTGIVLSGCCVKGNFKVNDIVYVTNGEIYYNVCIKSIHKKQIDSKILFDGETGCLNIVPMNMLLNEQIDINIDKHMIVTSKKHKLYSTLVIILPKLGGSHDGSTITCGKRYMLYVGNIMRNCIAMSIMYTNPIKIVLNVINPIIIPALDDNKKSIAILKSDSDQIFLGLIVGC